MMRVISTDPRLTRRVHSLAWAEERARRLTLLVGSAEIQRRDDSGAWVTLRRFERTTTSRTARREVRG